VEEKEILRQREQRKEREKGGWEARAREKEEGRGIFHLLLPFFAQSVFAIFSGCT